MSSVEPTPEQFEAFVGLEDDESAIVMINLLRFRDEAEYAPGVSEEPCSGREAYLRYGAVAEPLVERYGGEVIAGGPVRFTLIGPQSEQWDEFVLVRYPTRQAFLDMVADPEYQAGVHHRTAALSDSRLIATRPGLLIG